MEMSRAERLKAVVRWLTAALGKTQSEIGQLCGYDNVTYFSQLLNGKKPITASLDEKIAALHPDINVEFLRGTSDSMFLSGPDVLEHVMPEKAGGMTEAKDGVFLSKEALQLFLDLSAAVRIQQETIILLVTDKLNQQ